MKKTIQIIQKAIASYRDAPFVRQLTLQITKNDTKNVRSGLADMRDNDAIADAIYHWIVHHVNYVHDSTGIERLQMPDTTIYSDAGNCDDMAILSGAMLESVGVPSRIRLLGECPGRFSHIFIQYRSDGGTWESFDPTLSLYPGYRFDPAHIKAPKIVPIGGSGSGFHTDSPFFGRTGSVFHYLN
jgi:transglutaminase-like putative cysteine protease